MIEEAEAIKEVAITIGKGIDAVRDAGRFLAPYIGGPLEQAMAIIEDKFKYIRMERQVRLFQRANELLREQGIQQPGRLLELKIAIPLVIGGSLEENNDLQDIWAALLANAANANSEVEIRRAFISILEDLTPLDALVLQKIYDTSLTQDERPEIWTTHLPNYVTLEKPTLENLRPQSDAEMSLANLARLGLITTGMAWGGTAVFSCVCRTTLGHEFNKAISPRQSHSLTTNLANPAADHPSAGCRSRKPR